MSVELATAYVSIVPSFRGVRAATDRGLEGPVSGAGDNAGKKFSKRFSVAAKAGMAIAGVAIAAFAKDAINEASDVNESQSKVGVVFGSSAAQIVKASQSSAAAMGLSKGAYLDATGTLGNLLVSLKVAPKAAADMSQQMVKLAGDLASFNNVSPEEALAAIKSGLVGETEPLRAFGVNMNDATLRTQALKLHLIKTTKDALTPQAKALAAQALIMDQTKTAQGDFARTSSGLANQQRILAAQFQDVKAKVGAQLLPVMVKLANFASTKLLPTFKSVGDFVSKHQTIFLVLAATIGTIVVAVKAWAVAQAILNTVMALNPIALVAIALVALGAALFVAYKKSETFRVIVQAAFRVVAVQVRATAAVFMWLWRNIITPVFNGIAAVVRTQIGITRSIIAGVSTVIRGVGAAFTAAYATARRVIAGIVAAARGLRTAISPIINGISRAWRGIGNGLQAAYNGTIGPIIRTILAAIHTVQDALNALTGKKVVGTGGLLAKTKAAGVRTGGGGAPLHRALGGPVTANRPYIVGDGGRPELFVPDQNGRILPRVPTMTNGTQQGPMQITGRLKIDDDGYGEIVGVLTEIDTHLTYATS